MIRLIAPLAAAALVAACGTTHADAPAAAVHAALVLDTVRTEPLAAALPVAGTVAPRARAELGTRTMARVADVPAEIGEAVRPGQVLVRLGLDDIAAQRATAEAALRAAEAAAAEAGRHAVRMDTLAAADAVPAAQRDRARLEALQAAAQRDMARSQLAQVEAQAGYAEIRAPFAGRVVARSVDPGDLATPGLPLVVLESHGPRDGILAVPADLAAGLRTGDTLRVAGAGRAAAAPIRVVARGADPATRTVEVRVTLDADWPTGIGVTALIPGAAAPGIAIDASAIERRGQLTGVRVLMGDRPVLRWVRLGRTLPDGRVTVVSGLEPGERIVR